MLRRKLLNRLAVSVTALSVIFYLAVHFSLPDLLWWFDMPMHFLGGVCVFYFGAMVWLPARKYVPVWRYLYESIITAILLGVLWEALELYLYMHYGSPNFILLDSVSDIFFDLAGALCAAYMTADVVS